MRNKASQYDENLTKMFHSLGLKDLISFKFEVSIEHLPMITLTRYVSVDEVTILTEYFDLYDKLPNPALRDWARRKVGQL